MTASLHSILAAAAIAVAAAPVAAQAETALNMAVVSRTVFYLPAWVAQKQGFFKAAGLDVTMKVYDGSDQIYKDLRANTQQVAVASTESVIADAYNGGSVSARRRQFAATAAFHHRPARNQDAGGPQG